MISGNAMLILLVTLLTAFVSYQYSSSVTPKCKEIKKIKFIRPIKLITQAETKKQNCDCENNYPSYINNIPTRGEKEKYKHIGLLIRKENGKSEIAKLYGRQLYLGSNLYEYYITVSSMTSTGFDKIIIPIKPRKELVNNEEIKIPELDKIYTFKFLDYAEF